MNRTNTSLWRSVSATLMTITSGTTSTELEPLTSTMQCVENALIPSINEPVDCVYPEITASVALDCLRDKWVVFMGESTLRQTYLQMLGLIESVPFSHIPDQKGELEIEQRLSGSRYTFKYLPFYDNLTLSLAKGAPVLFDGRLPDLMILNDGLHDLLYNHEQMDKSWKTLSRQIQTFKMQHPEIPMMWIPPSHLHDEYLTKHRKDADWFTNDVLFQSVVRKQYQLFVDGHHGVKSQSDDSANAQSARGSRGYDLFYDTFRNVSFSKDGGFDGVHSQERARKEAEGLIRTFYVLNQDPALWKEEKWTAGQVMTILVYGMVAVVVLCSEICTVLFHRKRVMKNHVMDSMDEMDSLLDSHRDVSGSLKASSAASTPNRASSGKAKSSDEIVVEFEWIFPECFRCFGIEILMEQWMVLYAVQQEAWRAMLQFMVCMAVMFMAESDHRTDWWVTPSLKHYDRDFFIFLHVLFLAASWMTWKKNTGSDANRVLSRLQSEEWKGIMQITFVMYHYYDAAEVYNLIRVFIGAYVWMTGFGNTAYFLKKDNFSLNRLFGMLFRLNFLVFWVCLLLNQRLMLYYICPLHTFFFLFTYTAWGVLHQFNGRPFVKEIKLVVAGAVLMVMFDIFSIDTFYTLWSPMSPLFSFHGTLYEWHFRTNLDHYATWIGMVCAVYWEPITHFLTVTLGAQTEWMKQTRRVIAVVICMVLGVWYQLCLRKEKKEYNAQHPYTEIIPILSYIVLRNMFSAIRPYYSSFLASMGQITLESYIFQYHLYMIDDAKSILTVIPGYPYCNFAVVSLFYLAISRVAFNATNTLRNVLYPPRSKLSNVEVLQKTVTYIVPLVAIYVVAFILTI